MRQAFLVLFALGIVVPPALGQESIAKSRIVGVGIFKNGLTVVKREVSIPQAGTYRLDAAPEPVHGTFWVESNCRVDTAVKMREFDVPFYAGGPGNLQEQLAGKKVNIHLKDSKLGSVSGTVAKLKPVKELEEEPEPGGRLRSSSVLPSSGFLLLKTAKGHTYVNPSDIAAVEMEGTEDTIKQRRPALVLTVEKCEQKLTIYISYLTHGLGWAPSYLVDITDPKNLAIEMAAVIRNELANLDNAEMKLISGFPSVQFAHVPSPLAPRTRWEQFLAALSQGPGSGQPAVLSNAMVINQAVISNGDFLGTRFRNLGATPEGEGVDLHFEDIGKRSLQEGETLSLSLARSKAAYERVVEWTVPDRRPRSEESEASAQEIWDVLHFRNPFSFPMTTAPAMVVEKGQFNGQRTCFWANAGEETFLRITRSLSVRAHSLEREEKTKPAGDPEIIRIGSRDYRRVNVQGEWTASNHRKQPIKMMVRRTVEGTVLSTEGDPKLLPREDHLHAVNSRQELIWTLNLPSGEEKTIHFRYSLLVPH